MSALDGSRLPDESLSEEQRNRLRQIDKSLAEVQEQLENTLKTALQSGGGMGGALSALDLDGLTNRRDSLNRERSSILRGDTTTENGHQAPPQDESRPTGD